MSKNADLAAILMASAKLEEAGKLDRILSIFDADPVVTTATAKPHHTPAKRVRNGKTVAKPGKVITRNPRQSMRDKLVATAEPVVVVKPEPVASKPARKPAKAAKPSKPVVKPEPAQPTRKLADGRIMLSGKGTITAGQMRRLKSKGFDGRKLRYLSMADAAEMYATA